MPKNFSLASSKSSQVAPNTHLPERARHRSFPRFPASRPIAIAACLPVILLLAGFCVPQARAQTTITAKSCNQSDVNAVINGPTHTAVNGDTIQIPAGNCSWSSGVTVPRGIGISIIGAGESSTNITDNLNGPILSASPAYGAALLRISSLTITDGTSNGNPLVVNGTCASGGCPQMRIDNISFQGWTSSAQVINPWMIAENNMWGVIDHSTVNSSTAIGSVVLVNINNGSWLGVGSNGDNSWSQPDNYGSPNMLYLENNTQYGGGMTDCDNAGGAVPNPGGCRFVARFNAMYDENGDMVGDHGTETGGRMRGGRQYEVYNNTITCTQSAGCDTSITGFRSATGLTFDNNLTVASGSFTNKLVSVVTFRSWSTWKPWGDCDGESPFDTNDGATLTAPSTFATASGTTLTDSSQRWTTNQFAPGANGKFYTVYDATNGEFDDVVSNTATALTIQHPVPSEWKAGDTYYINGTTLYASGTISSVSGSTITDTSKSWTASQWVDNGDPYSFIDITTLESGLNNYGISWSDVGWEISGNTPNTISLGDYWLNGVKGTQTFNVGDSYVILRASVCLDQPARSGGPLLSGFMPVTPVGAVNQTLDPIYEWGDSKTGNGGGPSNVVWSQTMRLIANRDFYNENLNQPAQTSSSSPFNGDPTNGPGVGHGTLANRPTSCTAGVAYWATDQGTWNKTSAGGQGELFVCTATNTWTLYYTPYVYPHPLDTGNGPNPPSNATTVVH